VKLPNGDRAFIDERKLTAYVLNGTHHEGQHKAILFRAVTRFGADDGEALANWLRDLAVEDEVG
jgi:hypothetical protein